MEIWAAGPKNETILGHFLYANHSNVIIRLGFSRIGNFSGAAFVSGQHA